MVRTILAYMLLVPVLAGCASLPAQDPLEVTVAGIEPLEQKGEALELRMLVKLRVQNPNSTPVNYDGAYVKVEVQDRTFATGVSEADGTIAGFGEALVEVPVTVSMFRMFRNVLAMSGDAPADQLHYAMSGKLGSHRFKAAGEFSMKPPPAPATPESI
ncbi:MAG TPA: LEA type 2 family protein [Steroidobacteraceae bacterium]|nr:LEA type 2 family protein [Steroidobacteraceae bacterium]